MPRRNKLDVQKVLSEFRDAELRPSSRKGTFKIDTPFEEAVKSIVKAKPEPKPSKNSETSK
jgi:hypothetical protein